jgi:hypothetical protein
MCGWILNLARKYSLPVFAYQTGIKKMMNLGEAADRLHLLMHKNRL